MINTTIPKPTAVQFRHAKLASLGLGILLFTRSNIACSVESDSTARTNASLSSSPGQTGAMQADPKDQLVQTTSRDAASHDENESQKELDEAIRKIKSAGGNLERSRKGSLVKIQIGFSPSLATIERQRERDGVVCGIVFNGPKATDEALAMLQPFENLERIILYDCSATGTGLAAVNTESILEFMAVDTPITDAGLKHLTGNETIEGMTLGRTQISDEGLSVIGTLPNLRGLALFDNDIGDEGVEHLSDLKKINGIDLSETRVTDAGVEHLSSLSSLTVLSLRSTDATDDCMEDLRLLKNLRYLSLTGTKVSDQGIVKLSGLGQLRRLDVTRTSVTEKGIKQLKERLPDLNVTF